jgi:hypothetical protein
MTNGRGLLQDTIAMHLEDRIPIVHHLPDIDQVLAMMDVFKIAQAITGLPACHFVPVVARIMFIVQMMAHMVNLVVMLIPKCAP